MRKEDLFPKLVNQVILNFEDKGEMRFAVSDVIMKQVVEVLESNSREAISLK
jgi:hypothetical protein